MESLRLLVMETYSSLLDRELCINEWAQERLVLFCFPEASLG